MMKLYLLMMVLAVTGSNHPAGPSTSPSTAAPGEIGSRLPEFSTKDLRGRGLSSSALLGKVVLVDFWATWCQPCKKEMPGYQKLLDRYRTRGFEVVGFKFDVMSDTEDPLQFAKKAGVKYRLAVATEDIRNKFGGIEGLPTTMLYNRDGILCKKVIGFEYTDAFEKALEPLL